MQVAAGTVHGIVGENGAGKSTLMSILFGYYRADSGEVRIHGEKVEIHNTKQAIAAGIGMVHQHFMLVDRFTVLENVILGAEGGYTLKRGLARARDKLQELSNTYELEVPLTKTISDLTVGQQQRVEILKALYRGADILILDEPTSVLTPAEAEHLFRIFEQLKQQGKTVILITHKLNEIMAITDRVSVMRQGSMVDTRVTAEISIEAIAQLMVGRHVPMQIEKRATAPGAVVLSVRDLFVHGEDGVLLVDGVDLDVHAGEIVGIAGVAGNGQSYLLETISGLRAASSGSIKIADQEIDPVRPASSAMRSLGLGHVAEDRLRMGLVIPFEARENVILGQHEDPHYKRGLLMNHTAIERDTEAKMERFDIRPPLPRLKTSMFSGGNQQKLVLAREIEQDPDILIVGQPTRGVDIGAIEFIHRQLLAMRDAGKAILLVSVELDEIRRLSDRILVMCAGRIVGERSPQASDTELGLLMAGVSNSNAAKGGEDAA